MSRIPIIVGLGYGDEGKGTTVDYLTRKRNSAYVVRFSGGPQTAHNVVTDDGRHHTFSQFGSGTFNGAGTLGTEYMLVNPFNMVREAEALIETNGSNPFQRTAIDGRALLITPAHMEANRQRETNRGIARHGSCGEGVGETRGFSLLNPDTALRIEDMASKATMADKLRATIAYYKENIEGYSFEATEDLLQAYESIHDDIFRHVTVTKEVILSLIADNADNIVFEGSQGVLLDEVHGFHPNTTWSDTTNGKALAVLSEAGIAKEQTETVGILRTYLTRHGDGPFPTIFGSDDWILDYPEAHNEFGRWQGNFLGGSFDLELVRYANKATGGVDSISLTHCDREPANIVTAYKRPMPNPQSGSTETGFDREERQRISDHVRSLTPDDFIWENDVSVERLADILKEEIAPVSIASYGPRTADKEGITDGKLPELQPR